MSLTVILTLPFSNFVEKLISPPGSENFKELYENQYFKYLLCEDIDKFNSYKFTSSKESEYFNQKKIFKDFSTKIHKNKI